PFLSIVPKGVVLSLGLTPLGNPLTSQPTPDSLLLTTVAVKVCVVPVVMFMDCGDTLTATRPRAPLPMGAAPLPPQLSSAINMPESTTAVRPRLIFDMKDSVLNGVVPETRTSDLLGVV